MTADPINTWYDGGDEELCSHYPSLLTGPSLRDARLRANKRLGDVARYLGLDSSVPPRWEGDKGSTRYKPLPGKYIEPLAQFFSCSVYDIAPQLKEMDLPTHSHQAGDFDEQDFMLATAGCGLGGQMYSANASASSMSYSTIPSYISGSMDTPSPPPGLPPEEMRQRGEWRLRCSSCGTVYVERLEQRAPLQCSNCGAALRARTHVSRVARVRVTRELQIAA